MTLEKLGFEIKTMRKYKKWSQEELESYTGISTRTISKIENGFGEEIGIKKVETILNILGYEFSLREKGRPQTLEELQNARQ